jgi:D-glycero-alpha-D-manno-heptose 1-phosphate guanylyltransferase
MSALNPKDTDVVILCGGLGTRLKKIVNDYPKPMVEINGRPFLDILIDYIAHFGFIRFILCVGHMSYVIKEYYGSKKNELSILFSEEKELLDTAGALKNAEKLIRSNAFLVFNGDSLCEIDIKDFLSFHISKRAFVSVVLTSVEIPKDYGIIRLNGSQRVTSFREKIIVQGINLVNAGIYLFDRQILKEIPHNMKLSLEYDLFPKIIEKGIYGYVADKRLFDIGTPERLNILRNYFKKAKYEK